MKDPTYIRPMYFYVNYFPDRRCLVVDAENDKADLDVVLKHYQQHQVEKIGIHYRPINMSAISDYPEIVNVSLNQHAGLGTIRPNSGELRLHLISDRAEYNRQNLQSANVYKSAKGMP